MNQVKHLAMYTAELIPVSPLLTLYGTSLGEAIVLDDTIAVMVELVCQVAYAGLAGR